MRLPTGANMVTQQRDHATRLISDPLSIYPCDPTATIFMTTAHPSSGRPLTKPLAVVSIGIALVTATPQFRPTPERRGRTQNDLLS